MLSDGRRGATGTASSIRAAAEAASEGEQLPLRLLIVDDDLLEARLLRAHLDRPGRVSVDIVGSGEEALERLGRDRYDVVLTDLNMPGMNGVEVVRRVRETEPSLPVIVLTAHASLERAVEAMKNGATDFLPKPPNVDALMLLVQRAVSERPLRLEVQRLRERRTGATVERFIRGSHPRLEDVRRFAERVARMPNARVLITGETGTGKSLLARAIHEIGSPAGQYVEVNCATLPPHLMESELFGHEKGSFTDAKALKRGLVEAADRGTLFLDEISTLPLELQAKLLLFIERREIRRVGGTRPVQVSCRLVAATNEDLRQKVVAREFRQDLLYRLDVAAVEMPALRDMPEIIPELVGHFTEELSAESLHPVPEIVESCYDALREYRWPGNMRELRNAVERALIFHAGGPLTIQPPTAAVQEEPLGKSGVVLEHGQSLEEVERRYIAAALGRNSGDLARVAAQLGISRKTLWEKRRRYQL